MPYQISPLTVLILIRHIEARTRTGRKTIIPPRFGELAAGHVQFCHAGQFREGEFIGSQTDDGAIFRVSLGNDKTAVPGDFIEREPLCGEFGKERSRDVAKRGEEELINDLFQSKTLVVFFLPLSIKPRWPL